MIETVQCSDAKKKFKSVLPASNASVKSQRTISRSSTPNEAMNVYCKPSSSTRPMVAQTPESGIFVQCEDFESDFGDEINSHSTFIRDQKKFKQNNNSDQRKIPSNKEMTPIAMASTVPHKSNSKQTTGKKQPNDNQHLMQQNLFGNSQPLVTSNSNCDMDREVTKFIENFVSNYVTMAKGQINSQDDDSNSNSDSESAFSKLQFTSDSDSEASEHCDQSQSYEKRQPIRMDNKKQIQSGDSESDALNSLQMSDDDHNSNSTTIHHSIPNKVTTLGKIQNCKRNFVHF